MESVNERMSEEENWEDNAIILVYSAPFAIPTHPAGLPAWLFFFRVYY